MIGYYKELLTEMLDCSISGLNLLIGEIEYTGLNISDVIRSVKETTNDLNFNNIMHYTLSEKIEKNKQKIENILIEANIKYDKLKLHAYTPIINLEDKWSNIDDVYDIWNEGIDENDLKSFLVDEKIINKNDITKVEGVLND